MPDVSRGCPVSHTEYGEDSEIYGHCALLQRDLEGGRFLYNDTRPGGFYMIQRWQDVREALQIGAWTTDRRSALSSNTLRLLPQDLNGRPHVMLRRVLNQFFSPTAVQRMEPMAISRCTELIEELKPRRSCDFVKEFAIRYPTDLFLALLGLPVSDGEFFLPWTETLLSSMLAGDPSVAQAATDNILDYFDKMYDEREKNPRDPNTDLVTRLVQARFDEEPLSKEDVKTICLTIMLAGLDTTRSGLGYIYARLAHEPEIRRYVSDHPEQAPEITEEFLRLYPLVFQAGRKVTQDCDFHGLRLKEGDTVWIGIAQANMDPEKYPDPEKFVLNRPDIGKHMSFGNGPHRCLGLHLARLELQVVLREWHQRIPDYRIPEGTVLEERGAQLTLKSLPLEWDL